MLCCRRKHSQKHKNLDKRNMSKLIFDPLNQIKMMPHLTTDFYTDSGEEAEGVEFNPLKEGKANDFYIFSDVMGTGNTSVVFKAIFLKTREVRAVKFIKDYRQCSASVLRELYVLRNFNDCKYLVKFYSSFRVKFSVYISTEFCDAGSLLAMVEPHHCLPPTLLRVYVKEISTALLYLHSKNVMHRDLGLFNVVLSKTCHCKLTDFGSCTNFKDSKGEKYGTAGDQFYRAPEIYLNRAYSYPVDWWSLGVCVYRLFTGAYPFKAQSSSLAYYQVTKVHPTYPVEMKLDKDTVSFCQKLLVKNPSNRIGTISEGDIKNHSFFKDINWDEHENIQTALLADVEEHLRKKIYVFTYIDKLLNWTCLSRYRKDDQYKLKLGKEDNLILLEEVPFEHRGEMYRASNASLYSTEV